MVLNYGLCFIYTETNPFEEMLTLLPLNDLWGNTPLHCIDVGGFFRLLPFLVAWAWGFWVGWFWVAILF